MENTRIRICDIAEELGISTATVSNVIHGKTNKVSAATISRVQALLEERQYIPSMAGILLARNDSGIIGVIINQHEKYEQHVLEDPFISSSLNAISIEIEKAGKFMLVKTTTNTQDIIRFASMWNMEGLILIGFCEQDYLLLRQNMHIPFAAYDAHTNEPDRFCMINIDNYSGGFQMGEYFHSLSHKRVLCISDNDTYIDYDRYQGFCDGFKDSSLPLLLIPMQKEQRHLFYREKLEYLKGFTAIFSVSDYYAIDLIQFLSSNGILVPEQISVAGFDDTPLCRQVSPALTTIHQDSSMRAITAMKELTRLKSGDTTGSIVVLPVTLIKRDSTAPLSKEI